jgi:phage repressor protein C with HTH and peptisase S24 domain
MGIEQGFNDTILDRITKVMNMEGYTKRAFAEKVGIHYSNFNEVMKGLRGVPKSLPTKICNAFPEVRKEWLLFDDGEMYESEQRAANVEALVEEATKVPTKPRLPVTAAAGQLSDYLDGILAHECEFLPVMRSLPDYDFTMMVKGNSMEPKYEGGDEIACKKVESVIEWGKTYVLATRDGAVLKRLYQDGDGVRCVSYNNEEYPDFHVNGEDILGVYRVVGLIRV